MGYRRMLDRDGLFEDDELWQALGRTGVLIYASMWGLTEVWGGLEANVGYIARQTGAMFASVEETKTAIEALIEIGKIIPYKLDGKLFYWLKNIPKHNKVGKGQRSKIPIPSWVEEKTGEYPGGRSWWEYSISPGDGPASEVPEDCVQSAATPRAECVQSACSDSSGSGSDREKKEAVAVAGKGKGKGCRGKGRDKKNPPPSPPGGSVPLTGDDIPFSKFLKAFAFNDCTECKGEGSSFTASGALWPCKCVVTYIAKLAEEYLGDKFKAMQLERNPKCKQCLGFGIKYSGTPAHTKNNGLCDCKRPEVKIVKAAES